MINVISHSNLTRCTICPFYHRHPPRPGVLSETVQTQPRNTVTAKLEAGDTGVSIWLCSAWLFLSSVLLMAVCCFLPALAFHIDSGERIELEGGRYGV